MHKENFLGQYADIRQSVTRYITNKNVTSLICVDVMVRMDWFLKLWIFGAVKDLTASANLLFRQSSGISKWFSCLQKKEGLLKLIDKIHSIPVLRNVRITHFEKVAN